MIPQPGMIMRRQVVIGVERITSIVHIICVLNLERRTCHESILCLHVWDFPNSRLPWSLLFSLVIKASNLPPKKTLYPFQSNLVVSSHYFFLKEVGNCFSLTPQTIDFPFLRS